MISRKLTVMTTAIAFCISMVFSQACFSAHPAAVGESGAAKEGAADGSGPGEGGPHGSPDGSKEATPEDEAGRHFTLGLMMMNHGNTKGAEAEFLKTIELNPESFNARLYLARIYEKDKASLLAIEQYNAALKLREDDPRPYMGLMGAYLDLDVAYRAAEVGEDALAKGIPPRGIDTTLGWAYYKMGEFDKAEARFLAACEHTKDDTAHINDLGLVYFAQRKFDKALERFNEADRLNPKSTLVPYFQALTYIWLGDEDRALEALARGVERDPKLEEKAPKYNTDYFPHFFPGNLSKLFDKLGGAE